MEPTLNDYKLSCELLGHSLDVRAVAAGDEALSGAGQFILSGSRDKSTKIWQPTGTEYVEALTLQDHKNFISYIYYLAAEKWICTASNDATINIYKTGGYVPLLTLKGHELTVCAIASGVQPFSLISGSWDKTARVWQIDENGDYTSVVLQGHDAAVWAVATFPNLNQFVTGGADKFIYYWNKKGEKLRLLKGHTDCVRGLVALPDNTLVSCSNDASIRYWNEMGECLHQLHGHANYIYAIAQHSALGSHVIVSCGEDSTLRMWNVAKGTQLGEPLLHPAISVWSVTCLNNGDIVTGSSDGIVRVFTKDPTRQAKEGLQNAFNVAVDMHRAQLNEDIGGIKKTDLPGPEALLTSGTREGQTKMIRHSDGSVKCYAWELGNWNLVGDVTGASGGTQANSGKKLYEGKEYDFVFDVDISDTMPPIKLPYNKGDDPWQAAQEFIHKNELPQVYLDQVANFIIKNSESAAPVVRQSGYQDPFTGGSRYMPGSSNQNLQSGGNLDPFTGASSYTTSATNQPHVDVNVKSTEKHFPISDYLSFDTCDQQKVFDKLKEFNSKRKSNEVSEELLKSVIRLTKATPEVDSIALEALVRLLTWPYDALFPVIDVVRLAVRTESIFIILNNEYKFLELVLPTLGTSTPNQLMSIRCLTNMMLHPAGRQTVINLLPKIIEDINKIQTGSANLEIAIATLYLNITITQTIGIANENVCHDVTTGIVNLLKWSNDLEASYRSMQAIGNLTTTPHGQKTVHQVVSVDIVMDKLRKLTNTPQSGPYVKLNSAGQALLAAF